MKSHRTSAGAHPKLAPVDPHNTSTWRETATELTHREVADGIALAAARDKLYHALLDEAMRLTPARRGSVRLYDRQRHQAVFSVTAGDGWTEALVQKVYGDEEASACAHAVRTRELYVIDDVALVADYRPLWDDVRSHVSIPIFRGEEVVAVLSLDACDRAAFDSNHCSSLRHLAAECSNLLARFVLFEIKWFDEFEYFITGESDEQSLCDGAIDRLKRLFGVLGCSIFLLRPGSKSFTVASTTGIKLRSGELPAYEIGEGLTGWVAQHGRTIRLRDTRNRTELARYGEDLEWRNLWPEEAAELILSNRFGFLAAPLTAHNRVIGVLRLATKENGTDFEVEDEILLDRVAGCLALRITGIRELEHVVKLNKRLAANLDLEAVCRVIFDEGLRLFGCDSGLIRLLDTESRNLKLALATGPLENFVPKIRGFGEGISGLVAKQRKERLVGDFRKDPELLDAIESGGGPPREALLARICSLACFPLVVEDQTVGTLVLSWPTPHTFAARELKLMRVLADRCALGIEAALMQRKIKGESERRMKYMSRLRDMFLGFARIRNSKALLDKVLQTALEAAKVHTGSIWLREQGSDIWRPIVAIDEVLGRDAISIFLKQAEVPESRYRLFVSPGKARIIADFTTDPEYPGLVEKHKGTPFGRHIERIRSLLTVPIEIEESSVGVLTLSSANPYAFDESTAEYLEILGGYAAVAIEDAHLHEEHERALRLAQPLAMMGTMMSSFQHTMRNLAQRLSAALDNLTHPRLQLDEVGKYTGKMQAAVRELSSICESIGLFSHEGRCARREPVNLNEILSRLMATTAPDDHSVICELRLSDRPPIVSGNSEQLSQCISLIIGNAIEAMPNGGRLVVTTRASDAVQVQVKDTGVGMDAATKARCMEPFFTTKQDSGGRGMGLSVAFGIMKLHGGSLEIQSKPGEGTAVTLLFSKQEVNGNA